MTLVVSHLRRGPVTLAECEPESLYATYLKQLSNVATFVMDGDNLVLNLWADGGNMVFTPAPALVGITWQWQRFDDTADMNNIEVDDPSQYTLTLNADGTYAVKADCNQASGDYTLDGSGLTFEAGPVTRAECEPESHYDTYLEQLRNVATFVMDGDNLVLNLWADGGNMVFTPAPALVGITWQWQRFDDTADINNIEVDDPSQYTLTLNADGTYAVKADCNQAGGNYTLDGSGFTFEAGPVSLAECESGSLYDIYLEQLSNVATFVMDGDNLVLNLWADGGNMVFSPAE